MNELIEHLGTVVGPENLRLDADSFMSYGRDWTRFHAPDPLAVVMARDEDQLVRLVRFAAEKGLALVPSGGRTGLSGGAVAASGEVVVSFEKMNRIISFDETDGVVTLEPGVVTATLQQFARDKGWFYPVDFASSGSSHIGGNIATNAGGIKVLRYGLTRQYVAGLRVVTGAGEILDLNKGLVKNATGYDLRHLFVGSEGTLGFIVGAQIQLVKPPKGLTVALLAVPKMVDVIAVLKTFREQLGLTAFEFFTDKALAHVMTRHQLPAPFDISSACYVLLEFESGDEIAGDAATSAFQSCVAAGLVTDGVLSQSQQQSARLWQYREFISESISHHTPYKNDISVRVSRVPDFLAAVEAVVGERYGGFEIVWFGHIGDGNVHLNILKPEDLAISSFKKICEQVSEDVLDVVRQFEGSVSAEHGVGLIKRDQLKYTRSEVEIRIMGELKRIFDPKGIMNPGKLLP